MLSLCEATANPRAERSADSTVAPPTVKTTSPECGSVPLLVQQQGRDGRDGRDGLPGPVGTFWNKGGEGRSRDSGTGSYWVKRYESMYLLTQRHLVRDSETQHHSCSTYNEQHTAPRETVTTVRRCQ